LFAICFAVAFSSLIRWQKYANYLIWQNIVPDIIGKGRFSILLENEFLEPALHNMHDKKEKNPSIKLFYLRRKTF
jgi:hypothetical protein